MESQIYSLIKDSLTAYSFLTGVPVTFRSVSHDIIWECGKDCKVCCSNSEYYERDSQCDKTLGSAMALARKTGDAYIYLCDTGLINIVYAYYEEDNLMGYFIAGPIAMGQDRSRVIDKFISKIPLERIDSTILLSTANKLRLYSPMETRYLMSLFKDSILSHINASYSENRRIKSAEQDFVGGKIIELKKSHIELEYPTESERALRDALLEGHGEILEKRLLKYLEDLMVYDAGDISVMKIRLIVMFTRLLQERSDIHGDKIFEMDDLSHADTLKELFDASVVFAKYIVKETAKSMYSGNSELVKSAVELIQMNYKENIVLGDIADKLHVSKSYLSTLFRKETGKTLLEAVNDIRIGNAEKMLRSTNLSLTEIAFESGYDSQSYFCKMFKRKHGMTPREYREYRE